MNHAGRTAALRARLEADGGGAFVSLDPPTNQYLTGFVGTASAVIVTQRDALLLCDFRYTEKAQGLVRDYAVEEIKGSYEKAVAGRLAELDVARAVFDPDVTTVSQRDRLAADGAVDWQARAGFVAPLRQVKEPEEVAQIRAASALAEGALADVVAGLEAGVTERETAARLEYEFKARGASGVSFDAIVLFGARTSMVHGEPGDARLAPADAVLIDMGCRLGGYCSDLTRTYAFARMPGAWFEEIYGLTLAAQQRAIDAARPGLTCAELDAVARAVIDGGDHGAHFGHGLGHGVGIEVHEAPRVAAPSDTVLEPGMIITIEPGIYLPGRGGVRIEDVAAITENGCEVLSTTPKELRVLNA